MENLKEEVLRKLNSSILNRHEYECLEKHFKSVKTIFSNPDSIIEEELYIPGICFVLDSEVAFVMDKWADDLELSCWKNTAYWIEPLYSNNKSNLKQLCKDRAEICEAIINNLKRN